MLGGKNRARSRKPITFAAPLVGPAGEPSELDQHGRRQVIELLRLAAAFIVAVATLYLVDGVANLLLVSLDPPWWIVFLGAFGVAVVVGRYVWRWSAALQGDLVRSISIGATVTGAIGFCGGFFGPILLAPDANQGPLLGIFITGPLGFLLGAIGGGLYWLARRRDTHNPPTGSSG